MNTYNKQGDATRKKILDYLKQHVELIAPVSYAEIAEGTGLLSTNTVEHHLKILQEQGKIKLGGQRNIRVK